MVVHGQLGCIHMMKICPTIGQRLLDTLPRPKLGPRWALVSKTTKLWGLEGTLLALNTKRGRGACWNSEMELGRGTSFNYSLEPASNQSTSWLVHIPEHPWCKDKPRAILDSQDSPRPKLRGTHHLPPYSIICVTLHHSHPNGLLSQDSQGGVPKLSRFGLPRFCEFQQCVSLYLHTLGSGRFLTFNGRESNW